MHALHLSLERLEIIYVYTYAYVYVNECVYICMYTEPLNSIYIYTLTQKMLLLSSVSQSLKSGLTLHDPHALQPTRLLCPWDFPGKNTRVDCHFLIQRIFPTQRLNLCFLHWQMDSLPLHHLGSPYIDTHIYEYIYFF